MSDKKTLRDTFAAAALTGLLARADTDCEPLEYEFCTELSYKWADAMLRERAATNHDAAPAATAEVATGTGHTTREPYAWTVEDCDGRIKFEKTTDSYVVAEWLINPNNQPQAGVKVVPLYRGSPPPTLTDAEREALVWSIKECEREAVIEQSRATTGNYLDCALRECQAMARASTLRGLLARHGDGE